MREIKFRAWHIEQKRMIDNWQYLAPSVRQHMKLMQFTGLKDCKGVEIYEGDIVKNSHPGGIMWNTGDRSLIKWSKFDQGFMIDGEKACFCLNGHRPNDYEVIGNIYENPKLLGERSWRWKNEKYKQTI